MEVPTPDTRLSKCSKTLQFLKKERYNLQGTQENVSRSGFFLAKMIYQKDVLQQGHPIINLLQDGSFSMFSVAK